MFLFKSTLPVLGLANLITNGDFENGANQWNNQGVLDIVATDDGNYAKLTQRIETWHGLNQDVELTLQDAGTLLTAAFDAKFDPQQLEMNTWDPWTTRFVTAKLKLQLRENGENKEVFASCISSCIVPNGEWHHFSGNCYLPSDLTTMYRSVFIIAGADAELDMHIDNVTLAPYQRPRDWVPAANLRIDELRKMNVIMDRADLSDVARVDINMKKAAFNWGAMFDNMMPREVTDANDFFTLFNMGVARNEHKWEIVESERGQRKFSDGDKMVERFSQHQTPIRGHVAFWSVDGHSPDWYEGMEESSTPREMKKLALDWLDELINRYKSVIKNWDVFNEVIHGDFFRRQFGKQFWHEVLEEIRETDATLELGFNDYSMLTGNRAQCYEAYLRDVDLDFFGLQSHFKAGIDANAVNERLNIMAGAELKNRLWITEFDVENKDVSSRAKDVADFVRIVYAHPNTESLIMWSWLREIQRPWQPEAFNRALFEEDLTFGDESIESEWPLKPNAAGVAYLDMVKKEWNSTQVLELKDFDGTVRLFKGTYDVTLIGHDGNPIYTREVEVNEPKEGCDQIQPFEFEDDEYITAEELQTIKCQTYSAAGGFTGRNAALITERTEAYGSIRYLLSAEEKGASYKIKMAAKIMDPGVETHAKVLIKRGNQYRQVFYQSVANVEWFTIDVDFEVQQEDELFYLTFDDYMGDFMIDRFYFLKSDQWNRCKEVEIDFSQRQQQEKEIKTPWKAPTEPLIKRVEKFLLSIFNWF